MATTKPDVTLSDGREVFIDTSKVTRAEFIASTKYTQSLEEENATIEKVSGIALDDLLKLTQEDFQRLISAYLIKARSFVNPHSASESLQP